MLDNKQTFINRSKLIQGSLNFINGLPSIVVALFVFLVLLLISYLIRDSRLLGSDIGEYLNNPMRILNGELPYRDFWLLFSPGEVYFPAMLYKIFGSNIDTVRLFTIIASCLTGVFAFYFGKILGNKNFGSAIFSLLFFFSSIILFYEGPDYIHLYLTCALLSAMSLVQFFKTDKKLFIFLGGLFLGCGIYFRLYETGAIIVAYSIAIIIYLIINKKTAADIFKTSLLFTLGIIIIVSVTVISFSDILPVFYREVVQESVKNGTSMNLPYFHEVGNIITSINQDLYKINNSDKFQIVILFFHFFTIAITVFYYLMPFIAIVLFVIAMFSKPSAKETPILVLLFLWGLFSFPKGLGRSDLSHLAPSVTPFLIFMWYSLLKIDSFKNKKTAGLLKRISFVSVCIMFLVFSVPAGKFIHLKKFPVNYVKTSRGSVPFLSVEEAVHFKNVLNYIDQYTKVGDYIFVSPWYIPPIYSLTGRKDPTYYDSLNDLVVRPNDEKQRKLCSDLASHKTRIIIHNADWGYDDKPYQTFRSTCGILQNYIEQNYTLLSKEGDYSVYLLK